MKLPKKTPCNGKHCRGFFLCSPGCSSKHDERVLQDAALHSDYRRAQDIPLELSIAHNIQYQRSKILPISSEIDAEREIVLTRLDGVVPEDEVEDHNRRLGENPRFRPHYRQLVDLTGLTEIAYDTGAVKRAAEKHVFAPGARRAIVAPSDAAFGMSRMWAIQSEPVGQRIEVFRDMGAAKAWLGW